MTQYIGQITVIIDADNESAAETSIRDFAQRIEDESEAVVFADHNGDVENYEEIERQCKKSLESGPTPSLASVVPELLGALQANGALLHQLWDLVADSSDEDTIRAVIDTQLEKNSAAIAKATGGAPDAPPPIIIEVRGGVVQDVRNVPPGIGYEIRDYDNTDEPAEPGRRP